MRRIVVKREQERLSPRLPSHEIDRAIREQIRQVALSEDLLVALPEIMRASEAVVGEEIDGARPVPEELVVAAFQRAEPRHRVDRWEEFRRRYRGELEENPEAWRPIVEASERGTVTLLYSAHDTEHNGA